MELGSNPPVNVLEISETDKEQPLTLRYHHLRPLMMMAETYDVIWRRRLFKNTSTPDVSFDQLYLHPEKIDQMLQKRKEQRLEGLEQHLEGILWEYDYFDTAEEAQEMALDYTGPKGIYKQAFVDAEGETYKQILTGNPNKKVEMTWGPDIICNSCQSNGVNQPGNHCLLIAGPDEETEEKDFYRYVEFARTQPEFQDKIGELTDERGWHTFEMSLGTLRDPSFLTLIHDKFFEEIKQAAMNAKQSGINPTTETS